MKYINELAQIYTMIDLIEAHIDVEVENKAEALTLIMRLRGIVAYTLHRLEELQIPE